MHGDANNNEVVGVCFKEDLGYSASEFSQKTNLDQQKKGEQINTI